MSRRMTIAEALARYFGETLDGTPLLNGSYQAGVEAVLRARLAAVAGSVLDGDRGDTVQRVHDAELLAHLAYALLGLGKELSCIETQD